VMAAVTAPGHRRVPRAAGSAAADLARELAVPVPFSMDGLRSRLDRMSDRVVELAPMIMEPGAPSGVWFRTDGADYLCYEAGTSAFHQAHIVVQLAAHTLLAGAAGPTADARLVPDVSPRLAEVMLGDAARSLVSETEAEDFAFRALEGISGFPSGLGARRALRQLRPLRGALLAAVPEAAHRAASGGPAGARSRLYWAVIEIRDAALVLRPYRDRREATVSAAGLAGDELAAAAEAAMLAGAVRARKAGQPVRPAAAGAGYVPVAGGDLRSEAEWLVKVARAFSRLPLRGVPGGDGPAVVAAECSAPVADAERS
jgi:hypothetical protein